MPPFPFDGRRRTHRRRPLAHAGDRFAADRRPDSPRATRRSFLAACCTALSRTALSCTALSGLALGPLVVGCGDGDASSRRVVVPVSGRVRFRGQPAVGALVVLHPLDPPPAGADWSAGYPRGRTTADGTFRLATYDRDDGAPPGSYALVVSWSWSATAPDVRARESAPTERVAEQDRLEGRYADPARSPWKIIVAPPLCDLGSIELA